MAEIAWTRKYRPSSFDDYMGEDVKRLVVNRFRNRDAIPNTIMLYGTRGTGKTSMARILVKEIQCMNPVDGRSCGCCDMCIEYDTYINSADASVECPGLIEVDAATATGKDAINEIIEDAMIKPMYPIKYKAVILDECHMLSVSSQNSLLKVVEEPPEHLIFILCTTDPEKVLKTIHSRMQLKLEVRKKSVDEIVQNLEKISKAENLTISKEALTLIAKKGDRVPRECINLLETVAKNFGNEVTMKNVVASLGDIESDIYISYFKALNNSLFDILKFNKMLKEKDIAPKDFFRGLSRFTLDAMYVKMGVGLDDYSSDFVDRIKPLFKVYTVSECDWILQVIADAVKSVDSDDVKGELLITTTAMNLSKANLSVKNVSRFSDEAAEENKDSLRSYVQHREEENRAAIEKIPTADINKETFIELFNAKEFTGSVALQSNTSVKEEQLSEDEQKTNKLLDMFKSIV